jgi:hypothetical protein
MAKRYHQTHKDRMHEREGMEKHMKHSSPDGAYHEEYANLDMRRRREMEDSGYITEDHSAIANLPQNVMMKPYPYAGASMPAPLDDTISGVDRQMHKDSPLRHLKPHKF